MSEGGADAGNNDGNQAADSTSFASILAGVQRMRNEANAVNQAQQPVQGHQQQKPVQSVANQPVVPQAVPQDSRTGVKRINAFNQDRTSVTTALTNRGGLVKPSTILVNKSQTGNPLLAHIVNVNWSYVEALNTYDYQTNGRQILFLSLKYHKLHPEYIGNKMKPLMKKNAILLTVVDVENTETILKEINKICLFNEFTLLLAFNFEQAAKYLSFLASTKKGK